MRLSINLSPFPAPDGQHCPLTACTNRKTFILLQLLTELSWDLNQQVSQQDRARLTCANLTFPTTLFWGRLPSYQVSILYPVPGMSWSLLDALSEPKPLNFREGFFSSWFVMAPDLEQPNAQAILANFSSTNAQYHDWGWGKYFCARFHGLTLISTLQLALEIKVWSVLFFIFFSAEVWKLRFTAPPPKMSFYFYTHTHPILTEKFAVSGGRGEWIFQVWLFGKGKIVLPKY